MGMSIDQGPNIDLSAIIAGGADFLARMQKFKDAKETAEQALANLGLGKDARAALDEAARTLDEAKNKRDADLAAFMKQTTDTKASVEDWAAATKAEATKALADAQAQLADAKAKADGANAVYADASVAVQKAQDNADAVTTSAKTQANKLLMDAQAQADAMTKKAQKAQDAADATMSEALAVKTKYEAAIAEIRGAISRTT